MPDSDNENKNTQYCAVCRRPVSPDDSTCRFCGAILEGELRKDGKKIFTDFVERWEKLDKSEQMTPSMISLPEEDVPSRFTVRLRRCEKILEKNPNDPKAWFSKGMVLFEMDRLEEAMDCLETATMLDPTHKEAWNIKATIYSRLGKHQESADCYKKALDITSGRMDGISKRMVIEEETFKEILQEVDKEERDLEFLNELRQYEERLKNDPNDKDALYHKALALMKLERPKEAMNFLHSLTRLDMNYPGIWQTKGDVFKMLGDDRNAALCYKKAMETLPEQYACPICGNFVDADITRCPRCGSVFEGEDEEELELPKELEELAVEPEPKPAPPKPTLPKPEPLKPTEPEPEPKPRPPRSAVPKPTVPRPSAPKPEVPAHLLHEPVLFRPVKTKPVKRKVTVKRTMKRPVATKPEPVRRPAVKPTEVKKLPKAKPLVPSRAIPKPRPRSKPKVPTPRRAKAEKGLTNGIVREKAITKRVGKINGLINGKGKINGLRVGKINGLINGKGMINGKKVGRINGIINGKGRINGMVNGARKGRINGLINGMGRINGLINGIRTGRVNGLVNGFRSVRGGLTNGITNGVGITNGLGFNRFYKDTTMNKWKMLIIPLVAIVLLFVPYYTNYQPAEVAHHINIDGEFDDWEGLTTPITPSVWLNPSIDIVKVAVENNYDYLSFYIETKDIILRGGNDTVDTFHIFIDYDLDSDTGYRINHIGADYRVSIYGKNSKMLGSILKEFDEDRSQDDWNGWVNSGATETAINGNKLEAQIAWSSLMGMERQVDAYFYSQDYDMKEDFAECIVSNVEGMLDIEARSVASEVVSGDNNPLLELRLTAVDADIEFSELRIELLGTVESSEISTIKLFDQEEGFLTEKIPTSNYIVFRFEDTIEIAQDTSKEFVVVANLRGSSSNTIGASIQSPRNVKVVDGAVNLEMLPSNFEVGYIGNVPPGKIIDGGFSDWEDAYLDTDQGQVDNPNINIQNFNVSTDNDNAYFYLKVEGALLDGALVPVWNLYKGPTPPAAGLQDSDRDRMPDAVDPYPYDFNNDFVPDTDTNFDVDADGQMDYPHGNDLWLNTTIPSTTSFNIDYRGLDIRIYIGPVVSPVLTGEDTALIYIDSDNITGSGYSISGLGADYLVEIKGENGGIVSKALYRFDSTHPWEWKWQNVSDVITATDSSQLEARVDLSTLGLSPTDGFDAYFWTTDWDRVEDHSGIIDTSGGGLKESTKYYQERYETTKATSLTELVTGVGVDYDGFGWNVSYAGDVNGDGYSDIVVGAPYFNSCPDSWWNTNWDKRKKITFNNVDQSETLKNFTTSVKLTTSNFDYSDANSNGSDLRFIDPDGSTEYKYHYEEWDTSGDSYIWVNVTEITGSSKTDYMCMYYGYSSAPDVQDIPGSYDTNFTAVWHLNESSGTLYDATTNDLDGSQSGGVTYGATGQVNGAVNFDGNDDRISVSDDDLLDPPNDMTIEAWVNFEVLSSTLGRVQTYVAKRNTSAPWQSYELLLNSGDGLRFGWASTSGPNEYAGWNGDPEINTWYYTVGVRDGGTVRFYINGGTSECFTDTASGTMLNANLALRIGDDESEMANATVDEVRLSDTARSADWIAAQHLSMTDNFVTIESDEISSSAGAAYIFFGYPDIDLSNINTGNANVTIYGENAGDHFGWSVSDLGNVDSDTKDDLIIGAPDYDSSTVYVAWDTTSDTIVNQNQGNSQAHPGIAVDSEGNSVFVWSDTRGSDYDIYAQKFDREGNNLWSSSDVIVNQNADTAEYDWYPDVVVDSNDNAIVVWADNLKGASNISIYDQNINSDGEAQWGSSDVRVNQDTTASCNRTYPAIAIDSSDNVVVVWEDQRNADGNWSVYAQKLNSAGAAQWGSSDKKVNQNTNANDYESEPDVTMDSNGNAIAVWTDYRDSADSWIYAQKLNSAGTAQWSSSDVRVNQDLDDDKYRAAIDVDPDDNVIVVWQDERVGDTYDDIYAQKLNSSGVAQWAASDILVNQDTTDANRDYVHVAVDSSGHAIVVWKDSRHGTSNDSIYAQRLDTNGVTQWGSSDLRVNQNTGSHDREYPFVAIDDYGCAIVAWDDERTDEDVYAQQLCYENAGRAYIFYGKSSWSSSFSALSADVKIDSEYNGDKFGNSVSRADDVDNSDYSDIIIGAMGYNYDQGRAYIFYGDGSIPTSAGSADKTKTGENVGDLFGFSVSNAGDFNNDGQDDVIIGAPYNDDSGTYAGKAYIYYGGSTYAYVDSSTTTYGYMTNFDNAKSASDSGAYATLKEELISSDVASYEEHVIGSGATCDGAEDIEIIDFDEDGDMDAVTASYAEDKIAWWDNQGDDETFTERQIKLDVDTDGAVDVEVVDIDSDNDYDVFYAARLEDRIGWLENDGTNLSFTDHEIIESSAYSQDVVDIEVIDFDEDGYYDVVHAALTDDEISWFENDGTNDGWTRRNIADGSNWDGAYDVEVVDFDDDNDYDVVYAAKLEDRVGWFENDGTDLSFTDHEIIESSSQAQDVVDVEPIDFDEDGDMDVVMAASTDDLFSWWRNGGDDTTFDEAWSVTGADYDGAWEVSVVDFDDDADYDIVYAAMNEDRVGWFENDGTDTSFTDNAINESATQSEDVVIVEAVDFDLDGDYDVATAVSTDDRFTWWEVDWPSNYKMDIEFTTTNVDSAANYYLQLNYSTDGTETAFGVLVYDGSSWDDLSAQGDLSSTSFTTKSYTLNSEHRLSLGNVRVRFIGRNETSDATNSTLNIEYHRISSTDAYLTLTGQSAGDNFGWSVANVSDINQDGTYDDVIVGAPGCNDDRGRAYIYYGGDPMMSPGYNDIVTADYGASTVSIYNGTSSGGWEAIETLNVGSSPWSVSVGDANNDGYNDIVTADYGANKVSIFNGTSSGGWEPRGTLDVGAGPRSVFIGDANNDGYNDLLTAGSGPDTVTIYNGTSSGGWEAIGTLDVGSDPEAVFVGDANNDGYNDILTADFGDNKVSIYNGTSSGWESIGKLNVGLWPMSVFVGDANNDGYNDILTADYSSSTVTIYNGTSSGGWEAKGTLDVGSDPRYVFVGDANNDGYNDILTADSTANTVSIYNGTSGGGWEAIGTLDVGSDPRSVFVGDANNDGYNDILTADYGPETVTIYNGTSGGGWEAIGALSVGTNPHSVFVANANNDGFLILEGENSGDKFGFSVHGAGDVDGDGVPDVIVGAPYYDNGATTDAGNVYVYCGGSSIDSTADYFHKGTQANMHFGWSVSLALSMDGSSYKQVVVGGPHYDDGSDEDAGTAEVLYMFVIPEFSTIVIPIFVIILFVIMWRRRKHTKSSSKH